MSSGSGKKTEGKWLAQISSGFGFIDVINKIWVEANSTLLSENLLFC